MALLDLAARWAPGADAFLAVGHVNHGLRGRTSAADARFVRRQAAARDIPFRAQRVPVRRFARLEGLGIEEASRVLRYRALARMAADLRCAAVLAAHTLDDQAETVVMNLVRGAGPDGLGGMAPRSTWPVPVPRARTGSPRPRRSNEGPLLLRPLLTVPKNEILGYLRDRRVPFRTDATNALPLFFRNRVRPVLQAWEEERPGLRERLARLAEVLRDEQDYWDALMPPFSRRRGLDLRPFRTLHKAFQRRLLRHTFGFSSFAAIERARAFAMDPGAASRQSVPGGRLEKAEGRLIFRRRSRPID
jgi:tRNA(Ile)-lysidine synthase